MGLLYHNCPCCRSQNGKFLYKLSYGDVYKCVDCKTAYTVFNGCDITKSNEIFEATDFIKTRLYDQYRLRKVARKRLSLLSKFVKSGSILEFGSCTGEFLYECAKKDYEVSSVDLHPQILNINKAENLKEKIKLDANFFKSKQTYDAIAAFHVIEHLTNPVEFLSNCKLALKPKGILFLEVPNFGSLTRRIWGKRWGMFYDYHVCHFDKSSLENLLRRHGYHILLTRTIDETIRYISPIYNPMRNAIWTNMKRILYKNDISITFNVNNTANVIGKENEEKIINSLKAKIYRLESRLINGLSKIFFPISLLLNVLGLGSYIRIIARKDVQQ